MNLQDHGYKTYQIGKWGLGSPGDMSASEKGFDRQFGMVSNTDSQLYYPSSVHSDDRPFSIPENRGANEERCTAPGNDCVYVPNLFTDVATTWLEEHVENEAGSPFFMYLAPILPHTGGWENRNDGTNGLPVPSQGRFATENWPEAEKNYAAMIVEYLDPGIGAVLDKIDDLGLRNDTVVFFASDNGPHGSAGTRFFDSVGGLRGLKSSIYEGGWRVPLLVRWPGVVSAGKVSERPFALWDFLPTAMEIADVDFDPPSPVDGVSMYDTLVGNNDSTDHPPLYCEHCHRNGWQQAAIDDRWKLVREHSRDSWELYDIIADPSESRNEAANRPNVVNRLIDIVEAEHTDDAFWSRENCEN
jgi:arylsulfatase A-like enzyme